MPQEASVDSDSLGEKTWRVSEREQHLKRELWEQEELAKKSCALYVEIIGAVNLNTVCLPIGGILLKLQRAHKSRGGSCENAYPDEGGRGGSPEVCLFTKHAGYVYTAYAAGPLTAY